MKGGKKKTDMERIGCVRVLAAVGSVCAQPPYYYGCSGGYLYAGLNTLDDATGIKSGVPNEVPIPPA